MADYVTAADNDHDGVAEAVEKFILYPSPSLLRKSTSPEGRGFIHLIVTYDKSSP